MYSYITILYVTMLVICVLYTYVYVTCVYIHMAPHPSSLCSLSPYPVRVCTMAHNTIPHDICLLSVSPTGISFP